MKYSRLCIGILLMTVFAQMGCAKILNDLRRDSERSDNDFEEEARSEPAAEQGSREPSSVERRGSSTDLHLSRSGNRPVEPDLESDYRSQQESSSFGSQRKFPSSVDAPIYLPKVPRLYKNGARASRDDFIDQSQDEGSLWASRGQTNYYFTKNKVRSAGDLISVVVDADLFRDIGLESKRTLSFVEKTAELAAAQAVIKAKFLAANSGGTRDELVTSSAAPVPPSVQPTPAHSGLSLAKEESGLAAKAEALAELEKRVPRATFEDVDLSKSLEAKSGDILMGEILERFPNGNYKIRAVKRVIYKYGPPRVVSIIGVVKASDINEETDQIHSERLYEYRVDVAH